MHYHYTNNTGRNREKIGLVLGGQYFPQQEEKSLGGLRHLSILILSEKHLTPLVKFTVLAVVCPPPPTKYLAVVAF